MNLLFPVSASCSMISFSSSSVHFLLPGSTESSESSPDRILPQGRNHLIDCKIGIVDPRQCCTVFAPLGVSSRRFRENARKFCLDESRRRTNGGKTRRIITWARRPPGTRRRLSADVHRSNPVAWPAGQFKEGSPWRCLAPRRASSQDLHLHLGPRRERTFSVARETLGDAMQAALEFPRALAREAQASYLRIIQWFISET